MRKSIKVLAMAVACAAACALPTACNSDNKQPENQPDTPEVQRQEFTVTFRNGDNVTREQVESGATVTRPNNPSKDGHRFLGWYLNNVEYDFTTPITGNLVLEAKWEVETYTVRFVTNGAGEIASQDVVYQGHATRPEQDPRKDGHTFANWYADEDCTVLFDFDADEITQNTTIYAGWTTDSYTVTFDTNDGSVVNPQNITYQEPATEPEDPEKTGYTFQYWYENNAEVRYDFSTPINGPKTLHAKWERISYSVEFINNGVVYETTPVYYGETVSAPANNPSDATNSHNFAGWYADSDCTTAFNFSQQIKSANVKVYAKWVESFDYEFRPCGYWYGGYTLIKYNGSDTNVTIPSTFNGESVTHIGDYAFADCMGITSIEIPDSIRSIGSYAFANCTGITSIDLPYVGYMEGHVFDGWTAEQTINYSHSTEGWDGDWNDGCNAVFNCYHTVTVYDYDGNIIDTQIVRDGDLATEPDYDLNANCPRGFCSAGWGVPGWGDSDHFSFDWEIHDDYELYSDTYLDASYIVSFDTMGGYWMHEVGYYEGESLSAYAIPDPERDGYEFGGWYTDYECETEADFTAEICDYMTLYAKWIEK